MLWIAVAANEMAVAMPVSEWSTSARLRQQEYGISWPGTAVRLTTTITDQALTTPAKVPEAPVQDGVWSSKPIHEAIITIEMSIAARQRRESHSQPAALAVAARPPRLHARSYLYRGLCGRRAHPRPVVITMR